LTPPTPDPRTAELVAAVAGRAGRGRRVRRLLAGDGRLHVDRRLPFLCVLRRDPGREAHLESLVAPQPAYLLAGREEPPAAELEELVRVVGEAAVAALGGFLVVELCELPAPPPGDGESAASRRPRFELAAGEGDEDELGPTLEVLAAALGEVSVDGRYAEVVRTGPAELVRQGLAPVAAGLAAGRPSWRWLGLGVEPVYRAVGEGGGGVLYPLVLLDVEGAVAGALRRAFFDFSRRATSLDPPHPDALGRRALVRTAWHVDRRLAEVARSFEFLRLATPVNLDRARQEFEAAGGERPPRFVYRPLPIDPEGIKRTLFNLAIERVEDPTLARLFREKQEELDRQITMLRDRGTPSFLYGSFQLFGEVEDELLALAKKLLYRLPSHHRDDDHQGYVGAAEMVERASEEIAGYRRRFEDFPARVELCDDIAAGMMVSQDKLLILDTASFPRNRVEALLHHEVGTHLLTYCNGRAQRLRLLWSGLPGYNTLQEGLAVLAEFLAGGLGRPRLRLLAARVVACRSVCDGAGFVDTWRELVDDHGYSPAAAFGIAARVHRGGGLTKDAEYLRGLVEVLRYLGGGGELEPLYIGKIAPSHLPAIGELRRRGVLAPVPLLPRYLASDGARARLDRVRRGLSVLELVDAPS
jgi:uncharacterized protein (TIGR02421 family)